MSFQPTPRAKTVLDDPKLKLTADALPGGEGRPSFLLYYTGNHPRIDVYTQMPNDKDNGKIRGTLDVVVLFSIGECLARLADTDDVGPYTIENLDHTWKDKVRSKEPVLMTKTVMGKDKDGRIYIALLSADSERPKVRFYFGLSYYHQLKRGNEVLSDAEISKIVARAWSKAIMSLYSNVAAANYEHKDRNAGNKGGDQNRGRGNSGGNQRGGWGNNSGGGSKSNDNSFDDDLPF